MQPARFRTILPAAAVVVGLLLLGASYGVLLSSFRPPAVLVATAATPIHHLFFLIKENHAFENYFGLYPGALGYPPMGSLPARYGSKATVPIHPIFASNTSDLPHDRNASVAAYDSGRNDGFVEISAARHYGVPRDAAGYFLPSEIPAYYAYARNFTLADRFFTGILGPTLPNRIFDFAGTSGNWTSNAPPPPDAMEFPTIFDQLSAAGLRWAYDYSGGLVNLPPLFFPTLNQSGVIASSIRPITELQSQLDGANPPAVTYIDPEFDPLYCEHPPQNVTLGSNWTVSVLNAIFSSPIASSSAVFLFYDESGGYWDPIPPPVVGPYGDGFRVPLLVISPLARTNLLYDQSLDPASLLRFVDENWHLAYLNARVANAPSVVGTFDFAAPSHPVPMEPTSLNFNGSAPLLFLSVPAKEAGRDVPLHDAAGPGSGSSMPWLLARSTLREEVGPTTRRPGIPRRSLGRPNNTRSLAEPEPLGWTSRSESRRPETFGKFDSTSPRS